MERAYKYRIYPNNEQRIILAKNFGSVRFIYNFFLDLRNRLYQESGSSLSYTAMAHQAVEMKHSPEYSWLCEADATALQSSLRNLDRAFANFFKGNAEYPKFKSKKTHRYSYTCKNNNNAIKYSDGKITLPKIGTVRAKNKCVPKGRIVNATVLQVPSGKYYVSLCCEDVSVEPLPENSNSIGIDLGIARYCTDTNNQKVANPKYLDRSLKKLARLQRQLSRKTKGSRSYIKARIRLAGLHEHIASQRNDFLHKLSMSIVGNNGIISMETLDVESMQKNPFLSRDIADVSWSRFVSMVEYKSRWYGRIFIKTDQYFASSQICHCCGYRNTEVRDLSIRTWTCPVCGAVHDRDENASFNIRAEGERLLAAAAI